MRIRQREIDIFQEELRIDIYQWHNSVNERDLIIDREEILLAKSIGGYLNKLKQQQIPSNRLLQVVLLAF